jgi:hypothetical protein
VIVYCADVGSIAAGNFAWARGRPDGPFEDGTDIVELASRVADDLDRSRSVALGFECPLFVPLPRDPRLLTQGRPGDGNRAWCAGAGAGALAVGLTEVGWVLRAIRERLRSEVPVHLRWDCFVRSSFPGLLLWEAFISGAGKGRSHADDARRAVKLFLDSWPTLDHANIISAGEVFSLVGAGLLRSGWTVSPSVLASPCLVIGNRAERASAGKSQPRELPRRTGQFDSSLTRVVPVFCDLLARDPAGLSWLPALVAMPSREGRPRLRLDDPGPIEEARFGASEKPLPAPRALLKWLVEHPDCLATPPDLSAEPHERRALLAGDESRRRDARTALEAARLPERAWYVLEGASFPDVFVRTPELIVVIEGKRTERETTTRTKWMPVRHQMLRHLDGARELRGNRRVVGFFIIEGEDGADGVDVPLSWRKQCDDTIRDDVLVESLPHRPPADLQEIADGYLGVTTWQRVCRALGISYESLPERV